MRAEEALIDCIVDVAADPLVVAELISETLASLEALVAAAVRTTVTTCGVAVVALSFCGVAVCEVVDAAAAVCCDVSVVVMPSTLSARLSTGDKMSLAWRCCR